MIQKTLLRQIVDEFVEKNLGPYPSHKRYLIDPTRYDAWIDRLHVRLNELDILGYVHSQFAIRVFALNAFAVYARKQLEKAGLKTPNVPVQ